MGRATAAEQAHLDRTLDRARWATANLAGGGPILRPAAPAAHRVLHLMHNFGLPSETFIRDALIELEARGWATWVGTMRVENRDQHPFPPGKRLLTPGPQDLRGRVALKLAPGPMRGRQHNARSFYLMTRVSNPAILHAHFGWAGVDAMYAARLMRRPLLVSFHGTDLTVYPQLPEWVRLYQRLVQRLRCATVVSHFTEGKLRRLGYEGEIHVIPAGVRLERIPLRADDIPREPLTLLFVGRQVPIKGLDVLLRALPRVVGAVDRARLVVIGDGELRHENEAIARGLGLERRVEFRGALPHAEVLQEMSRAHMVIAPSRTMPDGQAEGSPVVTKEALAMGVPLVATLCGGIPETVPEPYRHELVPENDHTALAERILAIALEDDAASRQRVATGRRWARTEFDAKALAARIGTLYERLAPPSCATEPPSGP